MTLQLKLAKVKDLWGGASKPQYIYVEGGQCGSLVLQVNKLPQTIKCSASDHLQFIICGSKSSQQPQNGDVISLQDFWAEAFLDQNRHKWQNDEDWNPYIMQYFSSKHQKEGELHFEVRYNRGLFYQGQIQGAEAIRKKLVPLYKGPTPTSNFYNFLDSFYRQNPNHHFNFIQRVYKDE